MPDFKETIPLIKNLLAGAGVEAHLLPEKMTDLLRSAEIWWATRSAPVDIHAMGRTFAAHNLTSRCWARLKGWPPRRETGAVTNPGSGTVVQEPSGAEAELLGAATAEHEWLHEVCEVLRVNDLPAAQSWVDDYLLGIAADDYRRNYFEWLASALAVPPRNPKIPTGLKALADPFVLAAPRLLNYLGLRDIRALEVGELDELYRVILDRCEPADPIERIARGLRLFHDHLVRAHKVAALPNPRATFGEGGSLMPVDATLISVDEYLAALDWLEQQLELGADPIDTAISRIVLILTFRCGLRRGEVFGLRLCDVHDMGGIYLHIRRYPTHTLKTPSATRTVRIDPLLTSRERAWLRQCCKKRGADSTAGPGDDRQQSQLLSRPSAQEDAVSIEGTVRRVMRAVHAVTNDPRLVLHHLRHSCGSWLWLKLRVPDYPEVMDLLTSMPGLCRELGQARRLRTQLCGAVAGPSRMYSYVIARILGHASPTTSLEHYVHVDDLFLAATTLRVAASTPIGVWQGLTGASRSTIYEWLARGPHGVITGSRAREARSSSADVPTEVRVQSPHPWRKKVSAPSIRFGGEGTMAKVSRALQLYNRIDETTPHEDRLAQVAHRCSVKAEQVDTWIKLARSLARAFDIKSPLTGETFIAYTPVPAPDVELHAGIVNALNNLTTKFDDTARQSPSLVGEALALVPSRFNLRRHDVVFRGPEDSIEARTLLKLLDVAGLVPQHVRLTVRRVRADDTSLPSWFRTPRAKELVVKRIPPPGTEPKQAKAYARWAGIQLCSAEGRPQGHAWRIGLFLACIAFAEIQIKHMSSTLQQGASDLPVGSSTRLYGDDHD